MLIDTMLDPDDYSESNRGKAPGYVISGGEAGQFLVSNAKDYDRGLAAVTVSTGENGHISDDVSAKSIQMRGPIDFMRINTLKQYHQDIQSAAGTVIVNYMGEQYALVADKNYWFDDAIAPDDGSVPRVQIGGKIGVVQNPFGLNGRPPVYLGATTPIAGSAITKLTLSPDGTLYAAVWNYEPNYDMFAEMSYSLLTWNAAKLIQGALQNRAVAGEASVSKPFDRDYVQGGGGSAVGHQIPELTPARYNGPADGEEFVWIHGVASYVPPGFVPELQYGEVRLPTIDEKPLEPPQLVKVSTYAEMLNTENSAMNRILLTAANFMLGGYMSRYDERAALLNANKLTYNEFANANFVDFMATAFGQKISISSAGVLSAGWKTSGTVMSTLIKHAGVGATAGGTMDVVLQLGLQQIYDITNGKTGQKEFSITELLSAITGGAVVGAGVGAAFEYAAPYVSRVFGFVSEWIGGKLQKAKVTREVPIGESSSPVSLKNGGGSNSKLSIYETTPSDITGATEIRIGGKLVLTTPRARSMGYPQADAWYRAQVAKIPEMIDQSLSPQLQALQAWQLRQQIRSAATSSLIDQELVRLFENCHRLGSVEEAFSKLATDYRGDALYKKVVDASGEIKDVRYPNEVGGCFVAGTPVWTDKGLVPIEQIRVGDQVLSQPEGKGEVVYKTVVKTHVFDDKEIYRLNYYHVDLDEDFDVFVTGNHPFWVKDVGWTAAARLSTDDQLELQDGGLAFVVRLVRVFRTDVENVGWATLYEEDSGVEFDFRNGGIRMGTDWVFNDKYLDSREKNPYFRSKVFNIEVDGFHTYYVGEHGIWVHNLNCFEAGVVLEEPSRGGAPGKEIDVYGSETDLAVLSNKTDGYSIVKPSHVIISES